MSEPGRRLRIPLRVAFLTMLLCILLFVHHAWAQPSGLTDVPAVPATNTAATGLAQASPAPGGEAPAGNVPWLLGAGALVLLMQVGFGMVEAGLCRARNAAHTFAMNLMILALSCMAFWAYGFAIGWGGEIAPHDPMSHSRGIIGSTGFFLSSSGSPTELASFFFAMMLFKTMASIAPGAMAERWRWGNFCLFGLWAALPFGLFACWTWGGGWLEQMGRTWSMGHGLVDFAGAGVVHGMGGVVALVGAVLMGPRVGKFMNGRPVAIPGHNLPMVMGGTLVLAVGWLGMTVGSAALQPVGGEGGGLDIRCELIVVNTILAGMSGAIVSMLVMWGKFGKPDPSIICNGLIAGLVAIAGGCAFVSPIGAVMVGAIAGALVVASVFFWDGMGVDDPVGAISMHGVSGLLGLLTVGLFASGDCGAGYQGYATPVVGILPFGSGHAATFFSGEGWRQLAAQSIGMVVCVVLGAASSYILFKISDLIAPLRVTREVELQGLDIPEMGALGYSDFELKTLLSVSAVGTSGPRVYEG